VLLFGLVTRSANVLALVVLVAIVQTCWSKQVATGPTSRILRFINPRGSRNFFGVSDTSDCLSKDVGVSQGRLAVEIAGMSDSLIKSDSIYMAQCGEVRGMRWQEMALRNVAIKHCEMVAAGFFVPLELWYDLTSHHDILEDALFDFRSIQIFRHRKACRGH